jgi:NADH-quinone oxidoreductase subunit C
MLPSPAPAELESLLQAAFPGAAFPAERHYDVSVVTVERERLAGVMAYLRDAGYAFLTTCHGMHFPGAEYPFGMVYHLHDLPRNLRIRVKSFAKEDPPLFPSMTKLFPAADWMEREAYDFFGFRFDGHPNLKRILNMDDLEGWPLRKEYPLEDPARYDKDDKLFGR